MQVSLALDVSRDNCALQMAWESLKLGDIIEPHPRGMIQTRAGGQSELCWFTPNGRDTFKVSYRGHDGVTTDHLMDTARLNPPPNNPTDLERCRYHDPSWLFDHTIYPNSPSSWRQVYGPDDGN